MTTCPNQKLTGINGENYIYCNCSDCGFERVKGPCYLEEYFADKDNAFLNEERTRQRQTEGYKNNMKYLNILYSTYICLFLGDGDSSESVHI